VPLELPDLIAFPSTPEEMSVMLEVEEFAKRQRGLTHRGMGGYVYMAVVASETATRLGTVIGRWAPST